MAILTEPTWGTPTKSYNDISALCIQRPSPHVITGLLLQLCRAHFSDADNIVEPVIKPYIWASDNPSLADAEVTTKIQIEPEYKFKPETIQQRPSILVARGNLVNDEFLLGNGPTAGVSANGLYEGEDKKTLLRGTHNISCCGNKPMEADLIAEEVFFRMLEYKSVIKKDLNFSEFEVKVLNSLNKVDENHEHYKAVVVISWVFVYEWTLKPVSPILKKIGQIFNVE